MLALDPRLEVQPRIEHEASHSAVTAGIQTAGKSRDAPECTVAVDGRTRCAEIRMIQDVDRIDANFELFALGNPEALHHVHVQVET